MKLADLKAKGGFVPPKPIAKEVKWVKDGEELVFIIHVKRQSFGSIERLFSEADERSQSAKFIAESIFLGEDGKERITYEDAYQLDAGLAAVFIAAINEVNTAKN